MENKNIDFRAEQLHQEARALGQTGKYDLSISKLQEAMKIQPTWAYPVYDLALKFYKKTDELEPKGFFTTKTAIYSLEGEKLGIFPKGLYLTYMQIEWTDDINKKHEIISFLTQNVPDFAPGWKELADISEDETVRLYAINQGLSKKPDSQTEGILLINKAIILNNNQDKEGAKQILNTLVLSGNVTKSNVELAELVLNSLL
ncbi:hypothetical protein [Chryseobacterium sediminis]|uniref:Tetratricopeptide repeat protein n=1 Tax=Chryseobacterium sediminis TaxID=1679494 RepID=A0A5B2U2U2_9FLAO|nr:hypothetical protein [Chryseobacterium sediminis]KAA2220693.1 hypothetical protein FW780_17625 [Chryseobacterium sediminis]